MSLARAALQVGTGLTLFTNTLACSPTKRTETCLYNEYDSYEEAAKCAEDLAKAQLEPFQVSPSLVFTGNQHNSYSTVYFAHSGVDPYCPRQTMRQNQAEFCVNMIHILTDHNASLLATESFLMMQYYTVALEGETERVVDPFQSWRIEKPESLPSVKNSDQISWWCVFSGVGIFLSFIMLLQMKKP